MLPGTAPDHLARREADGDAAAAAVTAGAGSDAGGPGASDDVVDGHVARWLLNRRININVRQLCEHRGWDGTLEGAEAALSEYAGAQAEDSAGMGMVAAGAVADTASMRVGEEEAGVAAAAEAVGGGKCVREGEGS